MRLVDSPTERTTAATDLLLALVALGVAAGLQARPHAAAILAWAWGVGLIALSAALGAAYHGLLLSNARRGELWKALTFCLALALAFVACGVTRDLTGAAAAERAFPFLLAAGLAAFGVSRLFPGLFVVFILYEATVLLFALGVYSALALAGAPGPAWVAAGASLSLAGAAVQVRGRRRVRIVWGFDHNGIFHLFQAAGLVLMGVGRGMR
jgi:hypothetical protein